MNKCYVCGKIAVKLIPVPSYIGGFGRPRPKVNEKDKYICERCKEIQEELLEEIFGPTSATDEPVDEKEDIRVAAAHKAAHEFASKKLKERFK